MELMRQTAESLCLRAFRHPDRIISDTLTREFYFSINVSPNRLFLSLFSSVFIKMHFLLSKCQNVSNEEGRVQGKEKI
jgi:hypothetical protein